MSEIPILWIIHDSGEVHHGKVYSAGRSEDHVCWTVDGFISVVQGIFCVFPHLRGEVTNIVAAMEDSFAEG